MVFNNDVLIDGLERIVKKKKARFLCLMFKWEQLYCYCYCFQAYFLCTKQRRRRRRRR